VIRSDVNTILEIKNHKTYFFLDNGTVRAVDGVNLKLDRHTTLGLVGESGCGKTTTGRLILRLERPTSGHILLEGEDITNLRDEPLRAVRRKMQMIFQDPYASLNPRHTIGTIIAEPLEIHKVAKGKEKEERVTELLQMVGLNQFYVNRYPFEFSGGQRQRIGIARALALHPDLIVCDEPISSLDVSIQAQIINLLEDLQEQFELTYLFIAHDLSVVRHISDRIAVMYLGKIMELTTRAELYEHPLHPYTQALLSAVPIPDPDIRQKDLRLSGNVPSALDPPSGCRFHTRCPRRDLLPENGKICETDAPPWQTSQKGHRIFCHIPLEELAKIDPVISSPAA